MTVAGAGLTLTVGCGAAGFAGADFAAAAGVTIGLAGCTFVVGFGTIGEDDTGFPTIVAPGTGFAITVGAGAGFGAFGLGPVTIRARSGVMSIAGVPLIEGALGGSAAKPWMILAAAGGIGLQATGKNVVRSCAGATTCSGSAMISASGVAYSAMRSSSPSNPVVLR